MGSNYENIHAIVTFDFNIYRYAKTSLNFEFLMIKLYIFFTFFELTVKILAIGDLGNNFFILKKFTKKSTIHIINFPWNTASKLTEDSDGVEFFDSLKVSKQVRKINSIKSSYDLCIVISWSGARIAYL